MRALSELFVEFPLREDTLEALSERVQRRARRAELLIAFLKDKDGSRRQALVDEMFAGKGDPPEAREAFGAELGRLAAGEEEPWVRLLSAMLANDHARAVCPHLKPFSPFAGRDLVVIVGNDDGSMVQGDSRLRCGGLMVHGDCAAFLDRLEFERGWENEWVTKTRLLVLAAPGSGKPTLDS